MVTISSAEPADDGNAFSDSLAGGIGKDMVTVRSAQTEDIPRLHELWQDVFEDGDAFLDAYFAKWFDPAAMLVAAVDGRIVSMSTLYRHEALVLPDSAAEASTDDSADECTLAGSDFAARSADGGAAVVPDERPAAAADAGNCPCIFAVATDEAARGQGLAMELIRRQIAAEERRGTPCMMIAPAEESLFGLYGERFGFRRFFSYQKILYRPQPGGRMADAGGMPMPPEPANGNERQEVPQECYVYPCGIPFGTMPPESADGNERPEVQSENCVYPRGMLTPLDAADYNKRREELLNGSAHLRFTDRQIALEALICAHSGGGLFMIGEEKLTREAGMLSDAEGSHRIVLHGICAVERISDERVRINELLIPAEMVGYAMSQIHVAFGAEEYEIRISPFSDPAMVSRSMECCPGVVTGPHQAYAGMILSGRSDLPADGAYAGFVFD